MNTLDVVVTLRLTEAEAGRLDKVADEWVMTRSATARSLMVEAIGRKEYFEKMEAENAARLAKLRGPRA